MDGFKIAGMRVLAYTSPFDRTKEGLRRGLRQILIFSAVCTALIYFVGGGRDPYDSFSTNVLISVAFGLVGGVSAWLVYRLLRFTFAR